MKIKPIYSGVILVCAVIGAMSSILYILTTTTGIPGGPSSMSMSKAGRSIDVLDPVSGEHYSDKEEAGVNANIGERDQKNFAEGAPPALVSDDKPQFADAYDVSTEFQIVDEAPKAVAAATPSDQKMYFHDDELPANEDGYKSLVFATKSLVTTTASDVFVAEARRAFRRLGYQSSPTALKAHFVTDGIFDAVWGGDSGKLVEINLPGKVDRIVLLKFSLGAPRKGTVDSQTVVDGTLLVRWFDGRGKFILDESYHASGAGFTDESAELTTARRLAELIGTSIDMVR